MNGRLELESLGGIVFVTSQFTDFCQRGLGTQIIDLNFSISDASLTLAFSIGGIFLSLFYIFKQWFQPLRRDNGELRKALSEWIKDDWKGGNLKNDAKLDTILKDYEITCTEIGRRDNITLLTGTILITSSLIILGNTASISTVFPMSVYALASIGLYSIWLYFLHETSKKLNGVLYDRARAIEEALTQNLGYAFGPHSYIRNRTLEETACWLRIVRRIFWYVVLLLLSLAWTFLSIKMIFVQ